jgi:hypothetical protein
MDLDNIMRERLAIVETKINDHVEGCSKENAAIWKRIEYNNIDTNDKITKTNNKLVSIEAKMESTLGKINAKFIAVMLTIIGSMAYLIWEFVKTGITQ